jgi:hypothetical protein
MRKNGMATIYSDEEVHEHLEAQDSALLTILKEVMNVKQMLRELKRELHDRN